MEMKKKLRKFFTLKCRANDGFTLIELIITVAIMAILGGVGVPAYSGYVKKAERAADEELLASVNTAFASACMINGENNYFRNDVEELALTDGYAAPDALNTSNDSIDTAFAGFFEGGTFKVFDSLAYDNQQGMFINGIMIQIGEYKIAISKELADALKDNTFSEIGAEILTGKVDKVSDVAALLINLVDDAGNHTLFYNLVNTEEYLTNLMNSLGMDETEFTEFIMNEDGTFNSGVLANSLVLTAAQKTQGMDTSFLGTVGSAEQLRKELENPETATDAMAKLALTYGMYTSYVNTNPGMEDKSEALLAQDTFTGMTGILSDIETPEFQAYLNSSQGQADLNAYLASMQVISDSSNQSAGATKDILINGYTDAELVAALNGIMGNQ